MKSNIPTAISPTLHDEYIVLAGLPTCEGFIRLVEGNSTTLPPKSRHSLESEWRAAQKYFSELQTSEAGIADDMVVEPLPDCLSGEARESMNEHGQPQIEAAKAESEWMMVEIDRLVVHQRAVNYTYVKRLKSGLSAPISLKDLFQLATGASKRLTSTHAAQLSDNAFSFLSESLDMRLVDTAILDTEAIRDYQPRGRATKVIALFIGTSVNYIGALQFRNRLLLTDGHHRAFALRELGVRHAPCLVQKITRSDELNHLDLKIAHADLALFLSAPRPPLFIDFFQGDLRRHVQVSHRKKLLNIQFSLQESKINEL